MTAVYLIIVESPSKCTKIESYLGAKYKCIASKGHIRELSGLKSIDIEKNFHPTFDIISDKKDHIKKMKETISKFDKSCIYLATDDDREGEAIAWHICQTFDLDVKTCKRILFREITKPAILESFNNVTTVNMDIVKAQHTRQVLDVIVGFTISPVLWKKIYYSKSNALSAGRCQTPALRLIYENEKAKKDIETKYKTIGYFFSKNIPFELNHAFLLESDIIPFLEKNSTFSHKMTIEPPKEKERTPPKPFNTSTLLQSVNNQLRYSPKQTMQLCQKLYQAGLITYMRTENTKYAKPFLDQAAPFIIDKFGSREYLGNMDLLENKDKTNPHEAIRVTNIRLECLMDADSKEQSLYKIIWRNTMESCMSNSKYKQISVKITCPAIENEKKTALFENVLEITTFSGWMKVANHKKDEDQETLFFLQSMNCSKIPYSYMESTVTAQSLHSHYSESSLIKKLEDLGIGRPSTFAMIVDAVQDRGYVEKKDIKGESIKCKDYKLIGGKVKVLEKEKIFGNEKNKLVIKPLGILCIEFLLKHFSNLFEYDYTQNLEKQLDLIAGGALAPWHSICDACFKDIHKLIENIEKLDKKIYKLDDIYEVCFQQFGPVLRSKDGKGKFTYEKINSDITLDLEKLELGQYNYSDLVHVQNSALGKFQDFDIILKTGKYGHYVEWNKINISIKDLGPEDVTLDKIVPMIEEKISSSSERKPEISKDVLRIINSDIQIRTGKFGPYVFYKTNTMKKPQFIPLKNFKGDIHRCQPETIINWIVDSAKK
jgi:DNA topoisomerase-1